VLVFVRCVLFEGDVLFCVMWVFVMLCLIVVTPPSAEDPFAVELNNNNKKLISKA
jgi:hypothetical protein